jgi:hypothetical protein
MSYRQKRTTAMAKISFIKKLLSEKVPRSDIEAWEILYEIKGMIGKPPSDIQEIKEDMEDFEDFFAENQGNYQYMNEIVGASGLTKSEFLAKFKKARLNDKSSGVTLRDYTANRIKELLLEGMSLDNLESHMIAKWNKDEWIVDPKEFLRKKNGCGE